MLSVSAPQRPDGGTWVLEPKFDGFRLLIDVGPDGEVHAWSRRGTDLTPRVGSLTAPFADVAAGTTFDGELIALTERDGQPVQDFAAVTRVVFTGKAVSTCSLRQARTFGLAHGRSGTRACGKRFRSRPGSG